MNNKTFRIILMGAPGAGKGTQAALISKQYRIPNISVGNILKEELKNQTKLGLEAKSFMDAGKLVPDQVVIEIIKNRVNQDDCKNGFILDGMPRTIEQAKALEEMGIKVDKVIIIEVPDEKIIKRLTERRVCRSCSSSYHLTDNPPTVDNVCNDCGDELVIRADDNEEVIKTRLDEYHNVTEPLKEFYNLKGLLKVVEGQDIVVHTTQLVEQALEAE